MLLTLPFHVEDVDDSWLSKEALVYVGGSFETISGTVSKISNINTVLAGNQIVRNVTILIKNPGGITKSTTGTASVNEIDCYDSGAFSYGFETTLYSEKAGEIDQIYIEAGSRVKEGGMILTFSGESIEDSLSSYSNSLSNAKSSLKNAKKSVESTESSISSAQDSESEALETLEDAQEALQEAKDSLEDCAITSPVTGIVVNKNMLVGDIIGTSNINSTLATIYDVSAVTFDMNIDELDIMSVEVGQTVNVTADALENVKLTGIVTNVSLESTTSGGVTQYPITVRIDEVGDLLPGMNVTGEIVLEDVENALSIPVDGLKRGNVVYVKDSTVTEADNDVPAGYKAVTVETGLSDGDYIEIKSGLSEGDQIYVSRNVSETTGMEGLGGMFGGQTGIQVERPQNFIPGSSGGNRTNGQSGMPSRN
jgi:HlyD family secretion protein